MPLPAAQQQARERMLQEEQARNTPPVEQTPPAPAPKPPTSTEGDRVTITRDEFNELQAAADRVRAVEGRAEAARQDMEALQTRLTELEAASKGTSSPKPPVAPVAIEAPTFTEEENKDYGESRPYMEKVVLSVLAKVLPEALAKFAKDIDSVKELATSANQSLGKVITKNFVDKVKDSVTDFDELVHHKHWKDFTESVEPTSGLTYGECIANNHQRENLRGMVNVFNTFREKYKVAKPDGSGYNGAAPSGNAPPVENNPENERLKFSERKAAHKRYINHEISYEDFQAIKEKFDKADAEGRVDYDK